MNPTLETILTLSIQLQQKLDLLTDADYTEEDIHQYSNFVNLLDPLKVTEKCIFPGMHCPSEGAT